MLRQGLSLLAKNKYITQAKPLKGFSSILKSTTSALYTNTKFPTKTISLSQTQRYFKSTMAGLSPSFISGGSSEPSEKISNPSEVKPRKILQDVLVKSKMTIDEFKTRMPVPEESLNSSMQVLGIPDDPKHILGFEEMELLALEHDVMLVTERIPNDELPLRPPIMTIMGHVDHGKTTLLDALRNSNIAEGEYGGITQKIGAFMVKTREGKSITFIDTPGHEAFTNMRKRGSLSTDIVILVVSAVDGCQPQTFEAIEHAKNAGVPIIVAVNKIDKGANPEEVEKELYDYGLNVEPYGGNVPIIHISAKYKKNIDLLEELILFEAELMDLRADCNCPVEGIVLETKRLNENETKACTVVVQKGTLKVGDYVIAGTQYGRIKQLKDDRGNLLKEAPPSSAIEVIGLKDLPENGDPVFTVSNAEKAKLIAARRKLKKENELRAQDSNPLIIGQKIKFNNSRERRKFHSGDKDYIKEVLEGCESKMLEKLEILKGKEGEDVQDEIERVQNELESHHTYVKEMIEETNDDSVLNIIVKAQDKGTLETLIDQINKIAAKQDALVFNILTSGVGHVTETEIRDAKLFKALILGMDVMCPPDLAKYAHEEKVVIKTYKIIYDVLDELKSIFKRGGLSKPEITVQGSATIKQVFDVKVGKTVKKVAGVVIGKGHFTRKYKYRVMRGDKVVQENLDISSLMHHKTEVNEMKKGKECGVSLFNYDQLMEGDILEAYEIVKTETKKE